MNESEYSYSQLAKFAKSEFECPHRFSLSIVSDSTSQFLVHAIDGYAKQSGVLLDIYQAEYGQIQQELLNFESELHLRGNEFAIILQSTEKLLDKFYKVRFTDRSSFAENWREEFSGLIANISSTSKILINTFPRICDGVFGNYSSKVPESFEFQLSKINYLIKEIATEFENIFVCDIEQIQNNIGYANRLDAKFYINGDLCFNLDFTAELASHYVSIVMAIKGIGLKKCLILDLDDTTWGGVIGDDGLAGIQVGELGLGKAFDELQRWALELKNRGIIICVCSKNSEEVAREPFEKHPDMTLRMHDISVFVANWKNKADNISYIQDVLNIGFDSMVFLDDNPFERNLVRERLPEVTVPELPIDPVEYMPFLRKLNLFETAAYSSEDRIRTKRYQDEAKRVSAKQLFSSADDYLKTLQMVGQVEAFNDYSLPRVAQLTQRSNQFNLRTVRYNEKDLKAIIDSSLYITMQFSLSDKYGDYGITSLLIGEIRKSGSLFIDTWIMSCRVLKRGVEFELLNQLVSLAKKSNVRTIESEYVPTLKNKLVKLHYSNLGFVEFEENKFKLDVNSFVPIPTYIDTKA